MTLCNEWTIVKDFGELRYAKPLPCRSWNCDYCQPKRREQLMAQAASGGPVRFLTLTVNPTTGTDPENRLRLLAGAWRTAVKRLRRAYGPKAIEYFAVVEETKQGEPHLHILLRSPYIPQKLISDIMGELIDSPVVDIRRIKSEREVIRYVAKYITKAPKQFGKNKRYWCSQGYDLGKADFRKEHPESIIPWVLVRENILAIVTRWTHENYAVRRDRGTTLIAMKTSYEMRTPLEPT